MTSDQSSEPPVGDTALNYFVDGKCKVCDSANNQETVSCLQCERKFHMINCAENESDDCLSTSAFNQILKAINKTGKYATRPGNFRFICDPCMTKVECEKTCTTNDKVQLLDIKVSKLTQDIGDIKKLLMEKPTVPDPDMNQLAKFAASSNGNVWSNEAKVNEMKSLLVVNKNAGINCVDLENQVSVTGIQVLDKYPDKSGNTVILCNSQKSRDELKQKIMQSGVAEKELSEPKPRYPTISIVGIQSNIDKDKFYSDLRAQNSDLDSLITNSDGVTTVFNVLTVKPLKNNNSVYQAFVSVSDNVREAIKSRGDRLFLGWGSLRVFDQLYVKRCNKCQGYGHYMRECQSKQFSCAVCANPHETEKCPHKDKSKNDLAAFLSCVNCKLVGADDITHAANSSVCPAYKLEQSKLKNVLSQKATKNY